MRTTKKILMGLGILIILLVSINYGLKYYVEKNLPAIIHSEKDFPYKISYDDLDLNFFTGSFTIQNTYIAPKDTTGSKVRQGLYGKVKIIRVAHLDLWGLLKNDKISVGSIVLDTPEMTLYDRKKKYNVDDDFVKPFKNTVRTGSLEVRDGKFRMLDAKEIVTVKAANIDFNIQDIKLDSTIVKENIPVKYSDYKFTCDSFYYRVDNTYNITAANIKNSDSSLTIKSFKLIPKYSRAAYTKSLPFEKDLFNISVNDITVPSAAWGYLGDELYVHAPKVILNKLYGNVYRNKLPKDDPSVKKMYSELLRSIKFDLQVDRVLLKNSVIEYEEQLNFSKPPAKVTFSKMYATIHNVYSPVNKNKLPETVIDAQCLFMKTTPLNVQWNFNTLNKNDAFTIKGSLGGIRTETIDAISKPLMNIATSGLLKQTAFEINGNKNIATGKMALNYEDLKLAVYEDDDPKNKKKLLSTLGNLVVKNDSDGKLKYTDINVTRAKDKSFFNFLWLCLQDGIRKAILPKAVEKALPEVRPAKPRKEKKND